MKKKILFIFLIIFLTGTISAQISTDPQNEFYLDVQKWQARGLINEVPPLRPYPLKNIIQILNSIIENGNEKDVEAAEDYLTQIQKKPWYVNLYDTQIYTNKKDCNDKLLTCIGANGEGDVSFLDDIISIGYKAGFTARTVTEIDNYFPFAQNYDCDSRFDPAVIGKLYGYFNVNDSFALSFKNFIFQAGINRTGYGDFINQGLALNDSSYHMPQISLSFFNSKISYTQLMAVVGATTNSNSMINESGNLIKSSVYPAKFLGFHAIEITPVPVFSLAFYENVVFGKRFDFSYLIPTSYMISQSFSGFNDSIMMGLRAKITPVKNLVIASDLLVDDLGLNELVKLDFDSKNRIAFCNGVNYYPELYFFEKIGLNYTIVTPFTYAHWDVSDSNALTNNTVNYQNYTNCSYTIGTSYLPDSDVLNFTMCFNPVKKLNVSFNFSFMRHGNICETLTDEEAIGYLLSENGIYSTDGSIFTHQWGKYKTADSEGNTTFVTNYLPSAWNHLNFLNQEHKMYILKPEIKLSYEYTVCDKVKISLYASDCFEYVHNKGVDSDMYEGGLVSYDEETGLYTYGGNYKTLLESEVVNYYKEIWISKLYDAYNNYLSIGIEIKF